MAEYNIQINKYNGATADYDILYPQTTIENVIGYVPPVIPTITVFVETGTEVTCTNGRESYTKTTVDGKCFFEIATLGFWTISGSYKGVITTTENLTIDTVKAYSVTLYIKGKNLNEVPWKFIRQAADLSLGESLWAIGDTKEITLNGTLGTVSLNNLKLNAYIIGFDHNAAYEGEHIIHFKLGKIDNKQVAFVDAQYNQIVNGNKNSFVMETFSEGGTINWEKSSLRTNILNSDGTSSAINNLYNIFPEDLKLVLKKAKKSYIYVYDVDYDNNLKFYWSYSEDYISLLSPIEIHDATFIIGDEHRAEPEENTKEYRYYSLGNPIPHYKYNQLLEQCSYYTRRGTGLRYPRKEMFYCSVEYNEGAPDNWKFNKNTAPNVSLGIAPIFFV